MIIAVGYRVKSAVATRFRQWATARLLEYIVKGFTLDDERLKVGKGLVDYFDELLARICEIRASEARVCQRLIPLAGAQQRVRLYGKSIQGPANTGIRLTAASIGFTAEMTSGLRMSKKIRQLFIQEDIQSVLPVLYSLYNHC